MRVERLPARRAIVTTSAGNPLLQQDPQRVFALITIVAPAGTIYLWPEQQTANYGIAPFQGQVHVFLHEFSYPTVITDNWYCISANPATTIEIIEGRRIP